MKARKIDGGWFVRIDRGEEIMQILTAFIIDKNITAGALNGIGAVTDVELGYFSRETREYQRRKFDGVYELLSLNGNIACIDNTPMVHAHCVLGDADYKVLGGHLFSGIVAVTGEIYIRVFSEKFHRAPDPEIKLNLLDF